MKDYDISEKYKRIYQGILKWKQAGYKGLFQYTERIDIPLVISEVIQHVANQVEADPYVHIVVPDIKTKDSLCKRIVQKYRNLSSILINICKFNIIKNSSSALFYLITIIHIINIIS